MTIAGELIALLDGKESTQTVKVTLNIAIETEDENGDLAIAQEDIPVVVTYSKDPAVNFYNVDWDWDKGVLEKLKIKYTEKDIIGFTNEIQREVDNNYVDWVEA